MVHVPWAHNTLAQLVLIGQCQGQQIVNVHHFEATATAEATLLNDADAQIWADNIAARWEATCKTSYLVHHATDYTLLTIRAQVLERPGNYNHKLVATDTVPAGVNAGTASSSSDDMTTSAVIRWKSLLAGKSHRGRTYMGPLTEANTNAGRPDANLLIVMGNYIAAMLGLAGPAGTDAAVFRLTAYSRPYNSGEYQYTRRIGGTLTVITPPDYAGNSTFITSGEADPILRVQRRREIGRGA